MTKLLIFASFFLAASLSQAQQSFKVVKIQGKKAIVEMSDPSMVTLNQSYNVSDSSMPTSSGGKGGARNNAIAMDFSYQSVSSISILSLSGTYLWNMRSYEFGPVLGITNVSGGGGSSSSTTQVGALGYYNFNENKPGVETVLAAVGQISVASGGGSSSTNFGIGGNYRWFVLSPDHCFTFTALYAMSQSSGTSTSGFGIQGGIATYF